MPDNGIEARLRDLGFGYRARFLQQSAKQILDNHGPQWLDSLRTMPYQEARDALRALPGVGTKVWQEKITSIFQIVVSEMHQKQKHNFGLSVFL